MRRNLRSKNPSPICSPCLRIIYFILCVFINLPIPIRMEYSLPGIPIPLNERNISYEIYVSINEQCIHKHIYWEAYFTYLKLFFRKTIKPFKREHSRLDQLTIVSQEVSSLVSPEIFSRSNSCTHWTLGAENIKLAPETNLIVLLSSKYERFFDLHRLQVKKSSNCSWLLPPYF